MDPDDLDALNKSIDTGTKLSRSIEAITGAMTKSQPLLQPPYTALATAVRGLRPAIPALAQFTINDPSDKNKNFRLVSYTLNYQNNLAPAVKVLAGDISKPAQDDSTGFATLADTPNLQAIEVLTVQFGDPTRIEVSTGVDGAVRAIPQLLAPFWLAHCMSARKLAHGAEGKTQFRK
jgi:hypothetical protein